MRTFTYQKISKDAEQNDQISYDNFRINLVEYVIIRILILRDQILLHFVKQKTIQANQKFTPFPAKTKNSKTMVFWYSIVIQHYIVLNCINLA